MGKTKVVQLNEEQRAELEKAYKKCKSHAFRTRCRMVLLKSEKRTSTEVADFLGCCEVVVNNWLRRYEEEGVEGLKTRTGRGRPPILSQQNAEHLKKVKAEIEKHPNSVKTVVAVLEEDLDLQLHPETLKRLLKKWLPILSRERDSNQGEWMLREPKSKQP